MESFFKYNHISLLRSLNLSRNYGRIVVPFLQIKNHLVHQTRITGEKVPTASSPGIGRSLLPPSRLGHFAVVPSWYGLSDPRAQGDGGLRQFFASKGVTRSCQGWGRAWAASVFERAAILRRTEEPGYGSNQERHAWSNLLALFSDVFPCSLALSGEETVAAPETQPHSVYDALSRHVHLDTPQSLFSDAWPVRFSGATEVEEPYL